MGAAISMRVSRLYVSARSQAAWASAIVGLWSLGHPGKGSGRSRAGFASRQTRPGRPRCHEADLTGEPGDPPDDCPGCFGGGRGIAGLALDRDGGLIQLVPACRRPDQRAPAGKRYRVLERPPPLVGQRRIQLRDHADGELLPAQPSRHARPLAVSGRLQSAPRCRAGLAGPPARPRPFMAVAPLSSLASDRRDPGGCHAGGPHGPADAVTLRTGSHLSSPALTMLRLARLAAG
jgi:hypothetical protein